MTAPEAARYHVSVKGDGIDLAGHVDGADVSRVAELAKSLVPFAAVHVTPGRAVLRPSAMPQERLSFIRQVVARAIVTTFGDELLAEVDRLTAELDRTKVDRDLGVIRSETAEARLARTLPVYDTALRWRAGIDGHGQLIAAVDVAKEADAAWLAAAEASLQATDRVTPNPDEVTQ